MLEQKIEKLKQGDIYALDLIYEETQKLVFSICLSYMKDKMLAEDMMQDTYINVRKNINSYKTGNAKAWIIRIAKNNCLNELKRRKKIKYVGNVSDSSVLDTSVINDYGNSENTYLLNLALKILPTNDLKIVLLHVMDEKKLIEISNDLKIPEGTVRWRYNRAINKLRKYLERSNKNEINE